MTNNNLSFEQMKNAIKQSGGLFYQYRPCRRDVDTVYDIENIRHGVVYAQTPLNMNDPFDSFTGFSPEKLYDECIDLALDAIDLKDESIKIILKQLLKHHLLGKIADFIAILNNLKKYITRQRIIMHQTKSHYYSFIKSNVNALYNKCPMEVKRQYNQSTFQFVAIFATQFTTNDISAQDVYDALSLNSTTDDFFNMIEAAKIDYLKSFNDFLSKLTVSCFSSSGWDNQLMWAHYANSYAGICIEYDFKAIKEFNGLIYPIKYSALRPTISMKNLGLKRYDSATNSIEQSDVNIDKILSHILVKNDCWKYEKEWRIINIGEPYTSRFVKMPLIKSITIGPRIEPTTKLLLLDICKEKGISCYDLLVDTQKFTIDRVEISDKDIDFGYENLFDYLETLMRQIEVVSQKIETIVEKIHNDIGSIVPMLSYTIDFLSNAYFFKQTLNRILDKNTNPLSVMEAVHLTLEDLRETDNAIALAKQTALEISDNVAYCQNYGAMPKSDYIKSKKYLNDIVELSENYSKLQWDSSLCV